MTCGVWLKRTAIRCDMADFGFADSNLSLVTVLRPIYFLSTYKKPPSYGDPAFQYYSGVRAASSEK